MVEVYLEHRRAIDIIVM